MSFAEIFAAKIESKVRQEIRAESFDLSQDFSRVQSPEFDTSPAHLAFLMSQLEPRKAPATGRGYKAAPRPTPKPHLLSQAQQRASEFFAKHGAELSPAFRASELKNAFRVLAKKLHPDYSRGGSLEFIELKAAYDLLKRI